MGVIFLLLGMLWTVLRLHLLFCVGLFFIHEILIYLLANDIYKNGWIEQDAIDSVFSGKGVADVMDDLEYYSYLFVPGINLMVIGDIIFQATHVNDEGESNG